MQPTPPAQDPIVPDTSELPVPPDHTSSYGSDDHIGTAMLLPKPSHITRILVHNPNGFRLGPAGTFRDTLISHLQSEIDIALHPEINCDTTQPWVVNDMHRLCKQTFGQGQYRMATAHSPIPFHTQYKPGGVLMLAFGKTSGRLQSVGRDEFGRWAYMRFHGTSGTCITLIATYQVCQGNPKQAGPTTAITQQYSCMDRAGRLNPHRLRYHHSRDLCKLVQDFQTQGDLICVGGDFNETIGRDNSGLTRLCSEAGLVDPIIQRHGQTNFSTYFRGSSCIDYILVSPPLVHAITACGYEPFNHRILSDHRGLYLDVDTSMFFGSDTTPLPPMNARDYTSKHIHNTHQYFQHMTDHLDQHQWYTKIAALQECITNNHRNDSLANDLDHRRIQACHWAGKNLKRFPAPPWSPAIAKLRNINSILRLAIHMKLNPHEDCEHAMETRQAKLGSIGITIPDDVDDCRRFQRENLKVLRATEKQEIQSSQARQKHQEAKIQEYVDCGNEAAAKAVRKIQRAEATAAVYQQCAAARGKTQDGGLTYVRVPLDPTQNPKTCPPHAWKELHDPTEVAEAIRHRLQLHFSQAKGCNLTSPPFDITMDFDAACDKAEQILTGTFNTTALDGMTKALLDSFQYLMEGTVAVNAKLSEASFLGKIKAWNERTSTSPLTGIHLGHAKAYIAKTTLSPGTPEWTTFQSQRQQIIYGHLVLLNYALHFGHSYARWQSVVNAMLEKDPGNPRIHRLRVIHLYEWDFNLLLCVKWRELLHHVTDNRLINRACYGTTPGHSSLGPVFLQELEYEITRLTRRPLLHFDNDATSCYDRIPCFLANLASRKYGMDKKVCIVQAKTLQHARYYLKTKLGISDEHAEHTQECPWFGTGQGSGNSPFYWLLISSTLYDIYCASTTGGATYTSPDKSHTVTLCIIGFVDDAKNRTNLSFSQDSNLLDQIFPTLVEQATHDSQLWHDILTSANQALELSKCKYHLIHFQFSPQGAPSLVEEPDPTHPRQPLIITGRDGQPVRLTYVPSSKAIKYLGCHKCPAHQKHQLEALKKRCDDYARVVRCSRLSRRAVQVFYQSIYRLSVNYPLPVCYFTFKELDGIQKNAHIAMIQGCGYNSTTAHAVIFGPDHLQGAGFFHLYDEQGHGQVSYFLKSWRTPQTYEGSLLRVAVAWAQYAVGISRSIFWDTETSLPHFESHWMASLRQYLTDVKGNLEISHTFIPQLQRQQDQLIMDLVLTSNRFKPNEIRKVNYCRLYLRVLSLADICNANGTAITSDAYNGEEAAVLHNSNWCHVHQPKPGPQAWRQWRKACRLVIESATNHRLKEPLGAWIVPAKKIRRQWDYWHDAHHQILYHRHQNHYWTPHIKYRLMDFHRINGAPLHDLPATAIPVNAHRVSATTLRMTPHYNQWALPAPEPPPAQGFQPYFQSLRPWERSLLSNLDLLVPQMTLFQHISHHPFLVASDGSHLDKAASFGWILSSTDGQRLLQCKGPCFGGRLNSYRAEGYGLLSVSRFLYHLTTHFQVNLQSCHILCDNVAMVRRVSDPPMHLDDQYPNSTMEAEWDVLVEIWTTITTLPPAARPTFHHIKGHQDKTTPYADLSLRAQLNCDADKLAEAFILASPDMDYGIAPLLPTSGIQLHLPNGTISNKYKMALRLARTTPLMEEHLREKFGWSQATFQDIDWECSRRAYNRLRKHRLTLVKHANNYTPTGKRAHRNDPKYPPNCPSCPEPIEEGPHVHLCQNPQRVEVKNQFLKDLRDRMDVLDTPVDVMELLLEGIKSVFEGRAPETIPVSHRLAYIAEAQTRIGWEHVLRGRLTQLWSQHQQTHLGTFDPKKNGQTWATDIIQEILQGWLALWKHRNDDRHGRDMASRQRIAKAQASRELEQLYEYQGWVLDRHEWLFSTPLQARMNLPTHSMRAFINTWKPIIEESYQTKLETG